MTDYRRAGSRWRLLVHRMRPDGDNGASIHAQSHPSTPLRLHPDAAPLETSLADIHAQFAAELDLPGTEFDELAVGSWLHVEQLDTGHYWMSVGGVVLHVTADPDGRPTLVTVHTAGEYEQRIPGCEYQVNDREDT